MTRLLLSAQSENERTLFRLLSDNVDPCFTRSLSAVSTLMPLHRTFTELWDHPPYPPYPGQADNPSNDLDYG